MEPRVSIGLPVYNGENFLTETLNSILSQTYEDFEVVICDNASTDRTEEICMSFAQRDPRIRYYRNDVNLGASKNFNLTFSLARGEYFKWSAHDDLCAPEFLARCVEVLDSDPSIILCYTKVATIDQEGQPLPNGEVPLRAVSFELKERFYDVLQAHMCFEIFGLFRKSALGKTDLMGSYAHADGVLLGWLSLLGRFYEVPERLFYSRRHPLQAGSRMANRYMWTEWFNPQMKGRIVMPYWQMFFAYLRAIHKSPIRVSDRWGCYWLMFRWMGWYRQKLGENFKFAMVQYLRRIFKIKKKDEGRHPVKKDVDGDSALDVERMSTATTCEQGKE
jgi:glycosyltransferase involved in cell wall biosynthesis